MESAFHNLNPLKVIELVEDVLGTRAEAMCHPLASYINRVYEVPLAEGSPVVAKFYRPGRWSEDALLDEHEFVFELEDADIPVVAPLVDEEDVSLFQDGDMWFSLYPRKRGRPFEDPGPDRLQELGRTLARLHAVGDEHEPEHRLVWCPGEATEGHLDYILSEGSFPSPELRKRYQTLVRRLIDENDERFDDGQFTRIHGDCHIANLMIRPDESGIFLIDFDDMAFGPAVQDIWMLLPGTVSQSRAELDHLLHGYRSIRPIAEAELDLVEVLRAMRYVHFTSWCVQQQNDGGTRRLADDFGTEIWWRQTLNDLEQQLVVV